MSYIIVVCLVFALVLGGSTIAAGIMTGFMLFVALAVIYSQFPDGLKKSIVQVRLLVDFGISFSVFAMIGSNTATALLGAVTCGLLVTLGLHQQRHILEKESMLVGDVRKVLHSLRRL